MKATKLYFEISNELETKSEILDIFKETDIYRKLPLRRKKQIRDIVLALSLEKFAVLCDLIRSTDMSLQVEDKE